MAELNVELRAKVARLKSDLAKAEAAFKKTGAKADILSNKVGKTGAKSMRTFAKSTKANATPAMLEFSRVVQDAPFGIQGVANNIQQLTANFGNLSKKSGGAKAALKLMIGTLSGPAGILLAISAVTALMVAFGDKLKFSKDKAEDLNSELEKLNKNFELQLEGSDLLVENAKLQGKEYKSILNDKVKILNKQLESVLALIEQRKQLLLLNKESQQTVSDFSAISQSAVITAGAVSLWATEGLSDAFQEQLDWIYEILATAKEVLGIEIDTTKVVTASKKEKAEEKKLTEDLKRLDNERLGIINQMLKSQKDVTRTVSKYLTISQDVSNKSVLDSVFGITPEAVGNLEKKARLAAFKISNALRPDEFVKPKELERELTKYGVALDKFNTDLDNLITGGFSNTLSGIGQAIGSAMAEGGNVLNNVGKTLLGSFGAILSQLGAMMIEMGTGILLAKIALKSLNPYLAIAGGVALVAIGSAFSSSVSSLGGSTGAVAGQGSSGSTSSGGSSSTFVGGSSGYGEVVFRIGGQELIGVLSRVSNKNQRFGLNG